MERDLGSLLEKQNHRMEQESYIIRGGEEGRERLKVLSRVMRARTLSLLNQTGIRRGMDCLEVGCGSGDLAFDLARIVGAGGRVVATDIDEVKLELARREAEQQQLTNLEFRLADIIDNESEQFDLMSSAMGSRAVTATTSFLSKATSPTSCFSRAITTRPSPFTARIGTSP